MLIIYNSSGKMHAAGEAAGIGNEARYIEKAPAFIAINLRDTIHGVQITGGNIIAELVNSAVILVKTVQRTFEQFSPVD